MKLLELSKIFEDFITKHKLIEDTGRGMFFDDNPERDIDIRYKNTDFVLTIRKMNDWNNNNCRDYNDLFVFN